MLLRSGGEDWFAQLRLVFSCTDEHGAEHRCAFVRWLCEAEEGELPMQRLRWATTTSPSGATIAWYDVIDICSIRAQCCFKKTQRRMTISTTTSMWADDQLFKPVSVVFDAV